MKAEKKQIQLLVVIAILLVVFNVVAFALPLTRSDVFWLAWGFGNFAILAQALIFRIAFKQGKTVTSYFYGFPIARVGIIYMIVQTILSLLMMIFATYIATWVAVILLILVLAAVAIGVIATDVTREEVVQQDAKTKAETTNIRTLQSLSSSLISQCHDAETVREIRKLSELFRYSDPVSNSSLTEVESGLFDVMNDLKRAVIVENYDLARELCTQAQELLTERNQLCKLNKGK